MRLARARRRWRRTSAARAAAGSCGLRDLAQARAPLQRGTGAACSRVSSTSRAQRVLGAASRSASVGAGRASAARGGDRPAPDRRRAGTGRITSAASSPRERRQRAARRRGARRRRDPSAPRSTPRQPAIGAARARPPRPRCSARARTSGDSWQSSSGVTRCACRATRAGRSRRRRASAPDAPAPRPAFRSVDRSAVSSADLAGSTSCCSMLRRNAARYSRRARIAEKTHRRP